MTAGKDAGNAGISRLRGGRSLPGIVIGAGSSGCATAAGSASSRCSRSFSPGPYRRLCPWRRQTCCPDPVRSFPRSSTSSRTAIARPRCGRTARRRYGRCLAGFVLARLTGIPLGLAMGYNAKVRAACNYIVQFMRPLPPLSYLILLILWLGTGDSSKIALLYLTAFPIVASSAMAGVWSTKLQRVQAARSLGAGEWQIFRHVVFPSALAAHFHGRPHRARCRLFDGGRGRADGGDRRARLDGLLGQPFPAQRRHHDGDHRARHSWHGA